MAADASSASAANIISVKLRHTPETRNDACGNRRLWFFLFYSMAHFSEKVTYKPISNTGAAAIFSSRTIVRRDAQFPLLVSYSVKR